MIIDLPEPVWATVRASLRFQRTKLARKHDRTGGDTTARRIGEGVDKLTVALTALDEALGE